MIVSPDCPPDASSEFGSVSLSRNDIGVAGGVVLALRRRIEIFRALSQSLDMDQTLNGLLDAAAQLVTHDAAGVYLLDSDRTGVKFKAVRGYHTAVATDGSPPAAPDVVALVLATGELARTPVEDGSALGRPSARERVTLPIVGARGLVLGALDVISDRAHAFDPFACNLLSLFASAAASTLDSARLYTQMAEKAQIDRELDLARRVMDEFMPPTTVSVPGFDIATARETAWAVGGDYYELLSLGGNRWGVLICDVSGKGLGAALLVSAIRATVLASPSLTKVPTCLAARINTLFRKTSNGMFVTLFYGLLDGETHELRYVNAGHHAPMLLAGDGTLARLDEGGVPLGLFESPAYIEGTARLRPGTLLALYTDGIVEAPNRSDEQFGDARLVDAIERRRDQSAQQICRGVICALHEFGDSIISDDRTLVVMKHL